MSKSIKWVKFEEELTDNNYAQVISEFKGYVLIDFGAEWCGPCKNLTVILDKLLEDSKELGDGSVVVKLIKIDVDNFPNFGSSMSIRSIPFLQLFHNNNKISSQVGALNEVSLEEWVQNSIASNS